MPPESLAILAKSTSVTPGEPASKARASASPSFCVKRLDVHVDSSLPRLRDELGLQERGEAGTAIDVFTAIRQRKQQARRIGRRHKLGQHRRAVLIAPVEIVDREHDVTALAEPRDELAKRGDACATGLARIGHTRAGAGRIGDRRHTLKHRKHAGQRCRLNRNERRDIRGRECEQIVGQRVDERIERLERHRFLLVAASRQHRDVAVGAKAGEEPCEEKALAGARWTLDVRGDRGAGLHGGKRVGQLCELPFASDDRSAVRRVLARAL